MAPLVTAIITTYQRDKKVLKRAIDSVLNQTYKDIEILVIDDNGFDSNYHTIVNKLIADYKMKNNNINLLSHRENQGVQRARNNGLHSANGEFIAYLDDDDEWLPDKIEKQIEVIELENEEDIALVYGWYFQLFHTENTEIETKIRQSPQYSDEDSFTELLRVNYIGSTSVPLLRRKSVIDVGGFDESFPASQDYDLWLRLTNKFKIRCINQPLVKYHIHTEERISGSFSKKETATEILLNKYQSYLVKDTVAYGKKLYILSYMLLKQKKFKKARYYSKKAITTYPKLKYKLYGLRLVLKSYLAEVKNLL